MIEIKIYSESDQDEVIAHVLYCQNDGTRPYVSINDQPELQNIKGKYIENGGNFWVARENETLIGCIGMMKFDDNLAILKKFFVAESYRSAPHHLGRKLYETLVEFAKNKGIKQLILDTPKNTTRAHKFYEKAGFRQLDKAHLPIVYDYPYEDSDFFCLDL